VAPIDIVARRLGLELVGPAAAGLPENGCAPVSVVIPAYNRETMIRRALASVAAQELQAAEVVVVDDGSTDATADVARQLGARVLRSPVNQGAAMARLTGVREATQPWVAFLDSDDEWLPWMLSTLWPRRAEHVLVAGASIWYRDGRFERYEGLPFGAAAVLRSPRALVWPQNFVPAAGTLARRSAILDVSPSAPSYRYSEDFATWLRLLSAGTGLVVARPVVRYHLHAGQKTVSDARLVDQHAMVRQLAGGWPWGATQLRRRMVVDGWDTARTGARRSSAALVWRYARPGRALAVGGVLAWRGLQLRRQARLSPEGDLDARLW
jgi:hypothetical protein